MIDLADVEHYGLSDVDNRRTLRERIVPGLSASRLEQETPSVVCPVGPARRRQESVTEVVAGAP
ncbi:hypothetical protein AB0G86_05760 [Streptomyces scabiei]|uniref:hypothetical protein n=1 Tax=Streptomyces scabiei TaxID=1930 RepID=UPI0034027ED8